MFIRVFPAENLSAVRSFRPYIIEVVDEERLWFTLLWDLLAVTNRLEKGEHLRMTIKDIVQKGAEVLKDAPVSGVIKAGIFVGCVAFTAYVLIGSLRRNRKVANDDPDRRRSPVDEILGKSNYVSDPDAFDDMDPLAQKICRKLNIQKRSKKKRRREAEKVRTVSLFGDDEPKDVNDVLIRESKTKRKKEERIYAEEDREPSIGDRIREIGRKMGYAGYDDAGLRRKADRVAKDLGLNVDDSSDRVKGKTVQENPSLF